MSVAAADSRLGDSMKIENVVFDVGNVIVKWSPTEIVRRTFGPSVNIVETADLIFRNELWMALNRGELTEGQAKLEYLRLLDVDEAKIDMLFHHLKETQDLVDGTVGLLERLHEAGYAMFALTDNVREIVHYLRERYDFWKFFSGVIVSAEVGCLKPHPEIFGHLLTTYALQPRQTVFIDDVAQNVAGAENVGLAGILFTDVDSCETRLRESGLNF